MENPSLHIVIVEDGSSIRDHLPASTTAQKIKTDIQHFDNRLQLINYINNPKVIPDLFFLKLNKPLQNVLRCIKAIRSQRILNRALLVVYSPQATKEEIEEAFIERANIYMTKPTGLDNDLEEILKLAFQYKHSNLSVENLIRRL